MYKLYCSGGYLCLGETNDGNPRIGDQFKPSACYIRDGESKVGINIVYISSRELGTGENYRPTFGYS
jgi:hypothetical protein